MSGPDPLADLRDVLGAEPPPALAELPEAELSALAAAIRRANAEQRRALADALAEALEQVPRPLRPLARRLAGL
jgi:hypothetical protein